MRTVDVFTAGAIAGTVFVWVWGREIQDFLGQKTREVRGQTADAIATVADSVRA